MLKTMYLSLLSVVILTVLLSSCTPNQISTASPTQENQKERIKSSITELNQLVIRVSNLKPSSDYIETKILELNTELKELTTAVENNNLIELLNKIENISSLISIIATKNTETKNNNIAYNQLIIMINENVAKLNTNIVSLIKQKQGSVKPSYYEALIINASSMASLSALIFTVIALLVSVLYGFLTWQIKGLFTKLSNKVKKSAEASVSLKNAEHLIDQAVYLYQEFTYEKQYFDNYIAKLAKHTKLREDIREINKFQNFSRLSRAIYFTE